MAAAVLLRIKADAIVLDGDAHLAVGLAAQAHPGPLRLRMANHVGKRLADDLQDVDFLVGAQRHVLQAVVQFDRHLAALAELGHGVPQRGFQARLVEAEAEGGEQFAQLPVGAVEAFAQFVEGVLDLLRRRLALEQGAQAADLDLQVGQRLCQRVVQFAGDGAALGEQGQAAFLFLLQGQGEGAGDVVAEGLDQLLLPVLQAAAAAFDEQFAETVAGDGQGLHQQWLGQGRGLVAGAGLLAAATAVALQAEVRRALGGGQRTVGALDPVLVQAEGHAAGVEHFLQLVQQRLQGAAVVGVLAQPAGAGVEQFEALVALREGAGLVLHALFQVAVDALQLAGHLVEALAQLRQFVLAAVGDPRVQLAAAQAAGGAGEFAQRADDVIAEVVEGDEHHQQAEEQAQALHRAEQLRAALGLGLEDADETVDVADVGVQHGASGQRARVQAREALAQLLVQLADRVVGVLALQQAADVAAVEAFAEGPEQRLAAFQAGLQGDPVGEHAQRAGVVDHRGVLVRVVGEEQGAEHPDQRQRYQQGEVAAEADYQGAAQDRLSGPVTTSKESVPLVSVRRGRLVHEKSLLKQ